MAAAPGVVVLSAPGAFVSSELSVSGAAVACACTSPQVPRASPKQSSKARALTRKRPALLFPFCKYFILNPFLSHAWMPSGRPQPPRSGGPSGDLKVCLEKGPGGTPLHLCETAFVAVRNALPEACGVTILPYAGRAMRWRFYSSPLAAGSARLISRLPFRQRSSSMNSFSIPIPRSVI